jgi:aquaporin Z
VAQCLGAIAVTAVFATIGNAPATYAANGYGSLSMINASLTSVLIIEVVLTAFFLIVIMGSTRANAPAGFAPLSIGLALTAIHLMSIPVSNTSVNPARSLGPAVFAGGEALTQLWVFWVAPIVGAVIGALIYRWLDE